MVVDANVANTETAPEGSNEQPDSAAAAAPPPEPATAPALSARQQAWSMPKSPITRQQADQIGRIALKAITGIVGFAAGVARYGGRVVRQVRRVLEAVPPALKLFFVAGVLMLFGVVGAIALHNSLGLVCTVVVIPVCGAILGALGHRWYSGLDIEATRPTESQTAEPATPDLQRSVQYVDKKLALALTSFGAEHHQQAMIALFQAKTAVELTLGSEQDTASYVDVSLRADDYGLRPRIRAGTGSTSVLREGNSLAAS